MLLHSFSKILLKGKLRRESFKSLQKIYPLFEEMTCSCSWHWNSTKMVCINKAKNINECLQFSFIISISFLNVNKLDTSIGTFVVSQLWWNNIFCKFIKFPRNIFDIYLCLFKTYIFCVWRSILRYRNR